MFKGSQTTACQAGTNELKSLENASSSSSKSLHQSLSATLSHAERHSYKHQPYINENDSIHIES